MKSIILKKLIIFKKKYLNYKKILINKKYFLLKNNIKLKLLSIYNNLKKINNLYNLWLINKENLYIANYLNIKDELIILNKKKKKIENLIYNFFLPININDSYNIIIEIHAATGGNESSLFAQDLFKMYHKYCEINNWKINIVNINYNNIKGYKEITFIIKGKNVYKKLKFESGGHRVQRIPITETQGRLHTSTCSIAVLPILPEEKLPLLSNNELKIDTFRSSGAGGQHVNTTDSAIRITHIPTGITVECQDERSQHKNKSKALLILKNKIVNYKNKIKHKKLSLQKKNLLGTGERSAKIRTYNFPKSRITDHRINLTIYNLIEVLNNGNLDLLINPLIQAYNKQILLSNNNH